MVRHFSKGKTEKGLRIKEVEQGGLADRVGLRMGDHVLKVNSHPVNDPIDFQFYAADEVVEIVYEREGDPQTVRILREDWPPLGITFEPIQPMVCGNRCVFCFVDQNPKGLRPSLYLKDEDYRFSFLYGHYVTLTRASEDDLHRIVTQQLSPLYVSIHATDPAVRMRLLGLKQEDHLLEKLRFLVDHGIEIHGQIVLCPGYNDGDVLDRTLKSLVDLYPGLRSVAVVPVGLTQHRRRLPPLRPVDPHTARMVLAHLVGFQGFCLRRLKTRFVFASDELYLLAGMALPEASAYEGYPQIENGVGLIRFFLEDLREAAQAFPRRCVDPLPRVWVVGTSVAPVLEAAALPYFRRIQGLDLRILPVQNRLFGPSVTVTGLLGGEDILHAFHGMPEACRLLIPSVCLNGEGLFLDNFSIETLASRLGRPVQVLQRYEDFYA